MKSLRSLWLALTLALLPVAAHAQNFSGPATITQPTTPGHCVKVADQGGNHLVDAGDTCTADAGGVATITGTSNQVSTSGSTGDVTLSLPSTMVAPGTFRAASGITNTPIGATPSTVNATSYSANGTAGITETCSVIPTGITIVAGIITAVTGGSCVP